MKISHIQHLYHRVGFGISPKESLLLSKKSKKTIVDDLCNQSKKNSPILLDVSFLDDFTPETLKNPENKMLLNKLSREKVNSFSVAWFERLQHPTEILREKMTLFWANHFVCENNNIVFVQQYNNILRENALGNFRDFVKKISKTAAMLNYLNNKQNKKGSPNENFARELMELFTLGQNQYSENDIKEAARAFTGYNHKEKGEFDFKINQHDDKEKTFFGKTGNFNGDDIIDVILEKKECARFISEKIYTYFVNEKINKSHIDKMVDVFYKDYNIEKLVHFVFVSKWFYEDENIGIKIKSPLELLIGIHTIVPYQMEKSQQIILLQNLLGQVLMRPPNVAGWKTGKYWIDSNTIITRLRLPAVLLNNAQITFSEKGNEESTTNELKNNKLEKKTYLKVFADWTSFEENFKNTSPEEMISQIISSKINAGTLANLLKNLHHSKKDFSIQLMSLPEYQLC